MVNVLCEQFRHGFAALGNFPRLKVCDARMPLVNVQETVWISVGPRISFYFFHRAHCSTWHQDQLVQITLSGCLPAMEPMCSINFNFRLQVAKANPEPLAAAAITNLTDSTFNTCKIFKRDQLQHSVASSSQPQVVG